MMVGTLKFSKLLGIIPNPYKLYLLGGKEKKKGVNLFKINQGTVQK